MRLAGLARHSHHSVVLVMTVTSQCVSSKKNTGLVYIKQANNVMYVMSDIIYAEDYAPRCFHYMMQLVHKV